MYSVLNSVISIFVEGDCEYYVFSMFFGLLDKEKFHSLPCLSHQMGANEGEVRTDEELKRFSSWMINSRRFPRNPPATLSLMLL